jgi:hypothetical protein
MSNAKVPIMQNNRDLTDRRRLAMDRMSEFCPFHGEFRIFVPKVEQLSLEFQWFGQ